VSYLLVSAVGLLLTVFALSAWSKIHSNSAQREFAVSLDDLGLVPARVVPAVAGTVSAAETLLAVGLTWSLCARVVGQAGARVLAAAVLVAASVLLSLLTVGIAISLRRGAGGRCACFGATARPLSRRHVVRNLLLLAVSATGIIAASISRDGARPAIGGAVIALAAGAFGGLLLVSLDDLVDLFAPARSST
jgi:hypothetical protein